MTYDYKFISDNISLHICYIENKNFDYDIVTYTAIYNIHIIEGTI